MKLFAFLILLLTGQGEAQHRTVYIPLPQAEYAYNLVKECPSVDVTWIVDDADLVVAWDSSEGRIHWVLYTKKGKVVDAGETIHVSSAAKDICKASRKEY